MKKTKPLNNSIFVLAIITLATTGCATKGPRKVYAGRVYPPTVKTSPLLQGVGYAPRTQPGKVMDPEVETYTQVPTRIIYFPGEHTPFSRQSPKQEVAYSLKPINRSPGLPAPKIDFEPAVGGDQPNTFPTGFLNKDGSVTQGEGRRLGVNEATEPGKQRAEDLLKKGEELRWSSSVGWIGFKASKTEKKIEQSGTNNTIPDLPKQAPHGKPPEIDPIGNLGSGKTEEAKKDEPEINFNKEFNPSPTK